VTRRDEGGSALVEVTWLAILLMVPLLYIVIAVFDVQRSAFGLDVAARAAGRAYATAPSEDLGLPRARAAARVALADQHLDADDVDLRVTCRPDPDNCLAPGAVIDVGVAYQVPLPLAPTALGHDTPSVRVSASHSEPYGTFREDR
jgi:Flp pilus assembly protein TadG